MYTLTDQSQFQACAIMQGTHKLATVHQEIMDWITKEFGVRAIDFFCETRAASKVPRQLIHVILETVEDVKKMQTDLKGKTEITERFLKYFKSADSDNLIPDFLKSNVFPVETNPYPAIIVSYRPLKGVSGKTREEMLAEERLAIFKTFECMWTISQHVVFYYTDAQIKENLANGTSAKIIEALEQTDKKYDFERSYPYSFESKEYFDRDCESKWHYFWK